MSVSSPRGTKRKTAVEQDGKGEGASVKKSKDDDFRAGLIAFLEHTTISDILHEKPSRNLVVLAHNQTIADALHTLKESNILSAPVELAASVVDDDAGSYLGIIDVGHLLRQFVKGYEFKKDEHGKYSEDQLRTLGTDFCKRLLVTVSRFDDIGVMPRAMGSTLLVDMLKEVFPATDVKPNHRIALFDAAGKVARIITQSDVVNSLYRHREQFGHDLRRRTVYEMGIGRQKRRVYAVREHTPTIETFIGMFDHEVTSAAIVDGEGSLVSAISASDLRGMTGADFGLLAQPVSEFIKVQYIIDQINGKTDQSAHEIGLTCTPLTTFDDLLRDFYTYRVHRLFVVDEERRPIGVVTLSDILRHVTELAA